MCRTAGSGSGSGPGRALGPGLRARERGVLGVAPGPPRPLPLPPTPAVTRHRPSSCGVCSGVGSLGAKGHGTATSPPPPQTPLPETVSPYPRGRGDQLLTRPIGAPKRHFRCLLPRLPTGFRLHHLVPPPGRRFRVKPAEALRVLIRAISISKRATASLPCPVVTTWLLLESRLYQSCLPGH